MMASSLAHLVWFLLLACSITRSETDAQPVLLSPVGNVTLCPKQYATFTCRTIGGALLWRTTGEATGRVFNDEAQASSDLGIFRLSVTGVRKEGSTVVEVNSTATTLTGVQLEDDNIILTCLIATNFTSKTATLRVADLPLAPLLTSTTPKQIDTNSSSILISWNSIDCAVQYVVTINSSDGSVYPNITTSDTNTTVTLPNGVEYCATVVAVDAIGRRGPDSTRLCNDSSPTPTTSIGTVSKSFLVEPTSTIKTGTSSPTQSLTTSAIDLGLLVGVVLGVMIFIGIVVVIVVVITVIIVLGRKRKNFNSDDTLVLYHNIRPASEKNLNDYSCQVFFQKTGTNAWTFVFTISLKEHRDAVEKHYRDKMDKKYMMCDFQHKSKTADISITISDLSDGWIAKENDKNEKNVLLTVSRTAVEQYNGDGEPPHCEMIVKAAADDVTPSDLSFNVNLNGERSLTIKDSFEAQNVIECSVQVFYYYVNVNWWKVIIAFFPTQQQKQVVQIYQDANISSHQPLHFCGGDISIIANAANNTVGWCILKPDDEEHQEVKTAAIDRYNCDRDGKPPYCELALKAVSNDVTPPDLSLTVTLFGAKNPNTIILNRVAMTPKGVPRPPPAVPDGAISTVTAKSAYTCQVFYHRININHWRATFAFFPEEKTKRVKEFFQHANIGPTIAVVFSVAAHRPGKPALINQRESNKNGWTVMYITGKKIDCGEIDKYAGKDKPPHFEITLKPSSDKVIPSDHLSQSIILAGVNSPNSIVLKRALEKDPLPPASADNSSADVGNGAEKNENDGTILL